jgi:short-subunit dehydrogenase
VEKYEVSKAKRRFQVELLVPGNIRSRMLQEQANVSVEDIKATMHRMEEVKQQRRISVVMQEFEQWVIFYQSLKRKMKRLFDCNMRGKKISALE